MLYYIFIHLSCASSCNSDMRESIYSYMKKDSFPNEKTWVISICQSALGLRPQGLTHIGKLFIVVGQCKQEWTISQADSRGIWNWYLEAEVFWWWSEWEAQASLKTEATVALVSESAKTFRAFQGPGSRKGPGSRNELECGQWRILCFFSKFAAAT